METNSNHFYLQPEETKNSFEKNSLTSKMQLMTISS